LRKNYFAWKVDAGYDVSEELEKLFFPADPKESLASFSRLCTVDLSSSTLSSSF
jgi:hypothetical protein